MYSTSSEIIQTLREMGVLKTPCTFQLHEDFVIDDEVGKVNADNRAIIVNIKCLLLLDVQALLSKLMRESVFIDFLEEATA